MAILTLTLNPALDIHMFFRNPSLGILNRATHSYRFASGKGLNVSEALARQGVLSTAVLPLGGAMGELLSTLISEAVFEACIVPIAGESRSNTKVIDEESSVVSEFNGAGPTLSEAELDACREALLSRTTSGDIIIMSGSLPPGTPSTIYASLTSELKKLGATVVLDASGEPLREGLAAQPALLKPNRHEAETLLGHRFRTYGDAIDAAEKIRQHGTERIALSLGGSGAVYLYQETKWVVPPVPIQARNPTACGDALVSGLVIGLLHEWSWDEAVGYASAAATAKALSDGPDFPTPQEIERQRPKVQLIPVTKFDTTIPLEL
ncbi:MAG: 1-phosphofructokinase family hexose kinase [Trueperaceae bacterium]|nr:MAG: 1-phosphofructokinase family hexose kinase [Trueperaceae bacterium]